MSTAGSYDVIVIGGGAAGVAAAVGAAREGARTLMVERYGFLGGAASNAGVLAYCGFWTSAEKPLMGVRGVGGLVLDHLAELGLETAPRHTRTGNWIIVLDPEAVKRALDTVTAEAGVDILTHSRLVGAYRNADRIDAITLCDHTGMRDVSANAYVDASGQADLVRAAGGEVTEKSRPEWQRQPASYPVRFGGVRVGEPLDHDAISTCLGQISQPYQNARIRCSGSNLFRLPLSEDLWWLGIDILTDGLSGASLAQAEACGRDLAWRALMALKTAIPAFSKAYIVTTGPQVGTRDSSQAEPVTLLGAEDVLGGLQREDGIACGCWPAEIHNGLDGVQYRPIGGEGYFHVPLDSLRAKGFQNVWLGGRVIGCADETAYGSIRVMGTAFATGHAAGIAAALGATANGKPQPTSVRATLLRQGAYL